MTAWLSETDLQRIRDNALAGGQTTPETVVALVDQARQLDFVSTSVMFQRLQDVNDLLKRVLKHPESEDEKAFVERLGSAFNDPTLVASIKRCAKYLDELHGSCIKYKQGWPSAHIKW